MICIYCGEEKPPSKEHLLPRGLGGNLIGRFVCKQCNENLGEIDHALVNSALVTMARVMNTPIDAFKVTHGGKVTITDADGKTREGRITNQYTPELHPEMRFVLGKVPEDAGTSNKKARTKIRVSGSSLQDIEGLIKFLSWHHETEFANLYTKVVDGLDVGEVVVVHKKRKNGYLAVHAKEFEAEAKHFLDEDLENIISALQANQPESRPIPHPQANMELEIKINDVFRAVAKLAYGLAAERAGADFVLASDFDDLREYIRGNDIRNREDTPGDIPHDGRFVEMLGSEEKTPDDRPMHTVILHCQDGVLKAFVELYRVSRWSVDLGQCNSCPCNGPQILVSSGDRTMTRWLEPLETVAFILKGKAAARTR